MSYYDNQQWPAAAGGGQNTWEHQTPPARSGASSAVPREDSTAFASQLEEVDRAIENLYKSGKGFGPVPGRRESMPMGAPRAFQEQYGGGPRHHSVTDFGGDARNPYPSGNLQSFYATQRNSHGGHAGHAPSRASEAEQVMQAKRRMAAQRERELRNYHQEQQYNRSLLTDLPATAHPSSTTGSATSASAGASRSLSPAVAATEEERRELIARQRSALYGEGGFPEGGFVDENGVVRQAAPRLGGNSPLAFEGKPNPEMQNVGAEERDSASPSLQGQQQQQQPSRTSVSSPGGSPPRNTAPIGTRPQQGGVQANKGRSTTPGLPSPLSFGAYSDDKENGAQAKAEGGEDKKQEQGNNGRLNGWGNKSQVWGSSNKLGVQASVWG